MQFFRLSLLSFYLLLDSILFTVFAFQTVNPRINLYHRLLDDLSVLPHILKGETANLLPLNSSLAHHNLGPFESINLYTPSTASANFQSLLLGFHPSCPYFNHLPFLVFLLGGKIGKWYSDIHTLHLYLPNNVSLYSIQRFPCLDFIDKPKLFAYQQFMGLSPSTIQAGLGLLQSFGGMGGGGGMSEMQSLSQLASMVGGGGGIGGGGGMNEMQALSQLASMGGMMGPQGPSMSPQQYGTEAPYPAAPIRLPPQPLPDYPIPTQTLPPLQPYYPSSFSNPSFTPPSTKPSPSSNLKLSDVNFSTPSTKTESKATITTSISVISTTILPSSSPSSNVNATLPITNTTTPSISASTTSKPTSTSPSTSTLNSTSTSTLKNVSPTPPSTSKGAPLKNNTQINSVPQTFEIVGSTFVQGLSRKTSWPAEMNLWALDELDGKIDNSYRFKYSGKGTHVYLLDSGVQLEHPDFDSGKVELMFSSPSITTLNTQDCTGHGSHSAGLVAGKVTGVAKDAFVHVLRISGCEQAFTDKNILDAMEYLSSRIQRPAVVSIPLLPLSNEIYNLPSIKKMFFHYVNVLKVPIVVASGNYGTDKCSDFGLTSGIIAVGSHTETMNQASFSNYGICSNLYAPGTNVWSHTNSSNVGQLYTSANGTSVSTPLTAGVIAMMLEENPRLSPEDIQSKLANGAKQNLTDKSNSKLPILTLPLETYSVKNSADSAQNVQKEGIPNYFFIIGAVAGGVMLLIASVGGAFWYRKRNRSKWQEDYKPNSQAYSIKFSELGESVCSSLENGQTGYTSFLSLNDKDSRYPNSTGNDRDTEFNEFDNSKCSYDSVYFPDESFIVPRRERADSVNTSIYSLRE